jgi:hypothetical protein
MARKAASAMAKWENRRSVRPPENRDLSPNQEFWENEIAASEGRYDG